VLLALARASHAIIGFEIIGNFLYSQLVATAVYAGLLLWLVRIGNRSPVLRACIALVAYAFALRIHTLGAVHIAGAFCVLLAFDGFAIWIKERRIDEAMAIVRKYHGRVPLKWWLAQPYAVWLKVVANAFQRS
jgi:hypothetical protein